MMDFVVGLPATQKGYNGVWVVVDRLTETAHFLPFCTRWSVGSLLDITFVRLSGYMGFQLVLCQIEILGSPPGFGRVSKRRSVQRLC